MELGAAAVDTSDGDGPMPPGFVPPTPPGSPPRADEEDAEATVTDEDSPDEHDSEDEEDPADYKKGGYHPVNVGDLFKQRYRVAKKLGWGHFSTVWLVHDANNPGTYAALKIVKSAPHYTEAAEDEVKLLRAVRDHDPKSNEPGHIVLLVDDFKHYGPHGAHICMVMEVLGKNLLHTIKVNNYKGVRMTIVRRIIRQTLQGLESLHNKCKIIHTDIKPENILFALTPEEQESLASKAGKILAKPVAAPESGPRPAGQSGQKMTKNQKKNAKRRQKKKEEAEAAMAANPGGGGQPLPPAAADGDDGDDDIPKRQRSITTYNLTGTGTIESALPGLPEAADEGPPKPGDEQPPAALKHKDLPVDVQKAYRLVPDIKMADLGNSCWIDKHFSPDIQTRQYRSLEVILGGDYDTTADIWSVACMAFELATGDYLFEPHTGKDYSRDEDHCALITELLGTIPPNVALAGEYSRDIFNRKGEFRHITDLKPWSLKSVLAEKYKFSTEIAAEFAGFLLPMLHPDKAKRASSSICLKHPWLIPTQEELDAERKIADYRKTLPQ